MKSVLLAMLILVNVVYSANDYDVNLNKGYEFKIKQSDVEYFDGLLNKNYFKYFHDRNFVTNYFVNNFGHLYVFFSTNKEKTSTVSFVIEKGTKKIIGITLKSKGSPHDIPNFTNFDYFGKQTSDNLKYKIEKYLTPRGNYLFVINNYGNGDSFVPQVVVLVQKEYLKEIVDKFIKKYNIKELRKT